MRHLATFAALSILAFLAWTIADSPDTETPRVVPATVAPPVVVEVEE